MTLDIITDDLLRGTSHGFFGRQGGASSGVFEGLNCGYGSSDQHDVVTINRGRVAAVIGVEADHMLGVHQIHSVGLALWIIHYPLYYHSRSWVLSNMDGTW